MSLPARRRDRSPEKRRQILDGARLAFGSLGYERTSVDQVAARAGVSKATVYGHFDDKKALFVACLAEEADAARAELKRSLGAVGGDPVVAMRRFGERLVRVLISPAFVSLYRHTCAESERFPEVGETLFERGPTVIYQALGAWLRQWERLGVLRLDDARSAAVQFVMLCQGDLVVRAHFGVTQRPSPAEVRQTVRRAVATFLKAYGA